MAMQGLRRRHAGDVSCEVKSSVSKNVNAANEVERPISISMTGAFIELDRDRRCPVNLRAKRELREGYINVPVTA